jgi:nucleoside-diphosphate-sugar epimerase
VSQPFTPVAFSTQLTNALRDGWSIAITGASGWMGGALLEALEAVFPEDYDRRVAAFSSSARGLTLRSGRVVQLKPTVELADLPQAKWLLVHAAYATKDRVSTQGNDAYISGNEQLTALVSDAIRAIRPKAILFPSSGAVYDKSGEISTDLEKNPYGVLKHRDELHFTALAREIGARIVIPRVFNMSGPYINKWSAYALSDLIVQLLEGKTLAIQSPGAVLRSYVAVEDILTLCFSWLLDPAVTESSLVFDTRGEEDVEVGDLARRIEMVLLNQMRSIIRVADTAAPSNIYVGKPEPMRQLCAHYRIELQSLNKQIRLTAEDIMRRRA